MNNDQFYQPAPAPTIVLTANKAADRLAVAAFVCGLVGLILGFVPGFLGYAFYSDAKRRGSTSGLLKASKVLCILSMVLPAAAIALFVGCAGCMGAMMASFM